MLGRRSRRTASSGGKGLTSFQRLLCNTRMPFLAKQSQLQPFAAQPLSTYRQVLLRPPPEGIARFLLCEFGSANGAASAICILSSIMFLSWRYAGCCEYAGTQHGARLTLAKHGVSTREQGQELCGAHHFVVQVILPVQVTEAERSVLERLRLCGLGRQSDWQQTTAVM
jgi:hypothetical protein